MGGYGWGVGITIVGGGGVMVGVCNGDKVGYEAGGGGKPCVALFNRNMKVVNVTTVNATNATRARASTRRFMMSPPMNAACLFCIAYTTRHLR
jgi:hypothetical protein